MSRFAPSVQVRWLKPLLLLAFAPVAAQGQDSGNQIYLNQIGFYPEQPKVAIVPEGVEGSFHVLSADAQDTVFSGTLGPAQPWAASGGSWRVADFSAVQRPGTYVLAAGGQRSYPFEVGERVHDAALKAALKGFYYQRTATPLEPGHAGRWSRAAGHPDTTVLVHASAAGPIRAAGTVISSPKGWYDAGDYNKYVVNSGISTYSLLALHEHYPAFTRALEVDIPESGNGLPDVLDEALWNLRWMLTMQDPADGGVYHKLTNPRFGGAVTPEAAARDRYVVQKSTGAALSLAAVMAHASRIFRAYGQEQPGLSDSMLTASLQAWRWARQNPEVLYRQNELNRRFDPDIETGAYGDGSVQDELAWAAAELFITTGADSFRAVLGGPAPALSVPTWNSVRALAAYSLARSHAGLPADVREDQIRKPLLALADSLRRDHKASSWQMPMGARQSDFVWGSSAVAANQGMALVQAYELTKDEGYLHAAVANLDYLLGRNPLGYSFLTGHGERTPMNIHHRPSQSDDVAEPVPGLLSGGPNPGQQDADDCPPYPTSVPALSFLDHECSYASNEIAINWNAPLVYLAGAVEAILAADAQAAP